MSRREDRGREARPLRRWGFRPAGSAGGAREGGPLSQPAVSGRPEPGALAAVQVPRG